MILLLKKLLSNKFKRSIKERLGVPSMHWSLQNIKKLGFEPKFAVDIGAYEGFWTRDFLEVFPNTQVLMIEAQKSKETILRRLSIALPGVEYHQALLSAEDGKTIHFEENETASQAISESSSTSVSIKSETLDTVLQKSSITRPDFLKLDVQGFELEVLKGGKLALSMAEFCLLEVSFLALDHSPLVHEVIHFMDKSGFQVYDILQIMRRPYDKSLYQADFLFIKKNSRFISEKIW